MVGKADCLANKILAWGIPAKLSLYNVMELVIYVIHTAITNNVFVRKYD